MRKRLDSLEKSILFPTLGLMLCAVAWALLDNASLIAWSKRFFYWALRDFAWLYHLLALASWLLLLLIFGSRLGGLRLGGANARPEFSWGSAFAMTLTGGITTGIVIYGVNEPLIFYGNLYGELAQQNFPPFSEEAKIFALARSFHHWTLIPYAMYALVALLLAYQHHQRGRRLSITSALEPQLGRWAERPWLQNGAQVLAILAMALGLAASLGMGLTLLASGLENHYQLSVGRGLWLVLTLLISGLFLASSLAGLRRGIQRLSRWNIWIFYLLLLLLCLHMPLERVWQLGISALWYWWEHFFAWSLDFKQANGEALVLWWTLYDWAIWIAYAPLMGLFLARLGRGFTVRQFLLLNWILPALFGWLWFMLWGGSALEMQTAGVDLVATIREHNAVSGLWTFLQQMPWAELWIPLVMLTLMLSFVTAADSMTSTIAALCSRHLNAQGEAAGWLKALWGLSIGAIAYTMVLFGGGAQGVDGIKFLSAVAGSLVLVLFITMMLALGRIWQKESALAR